MSRSTHYLKAFAVAAAASIAALASASSAHAATASTTVTGGSLQFIAGTPGDVTFPGVTLNGSDQTVTQTQAFDVSDATGSSAGWSITATSTVFTAGGGNNLPASATRITTAPAQACDVASSCTLASNAISYPYTLPAGLPATKMYNATAGTGMGNQTITPTWRLTVPSTAWAGGLGSPYTSTWTFTLVSGP